MVDTPANQQSKYEPSELLRDHTVAHKAIIIECGPPHCAPNVCHVVCACGYYSNAPYGLPHAEKQRELHWQRMAVPGADPRLPDNKELYAAMRPVTGRELRRKIEERREAEREAQLKAIVETEKRLDGEV